MKGKQTTYNIDDTVEQMFNRIAYKYDFLNHFLSFGIDKRWRKKLYKRIEEEKPISILDIATGTGDMLLKFQNLNLELLAGLDPSPGMLKEADIKINNEIPNNKILLKEGFCEKLPFDNNTFDIANIVFGIRNFKEIDQSFKEIFRVLKAGGSVFIMEFSMPKNPIIKFFYLIYLNLFIPIWGRIISKDKSAYKYLSSSIREFSKNINVDEHLEKAGLKPAKSISLSLGIAKIYIAKK